MTWQWVVLLSVLMVISLLGFGLYLSHRQSVEKIRAAGNGTRPSGQPFGAP